MNFGDIFNIKIQDGNHSDKKYIGDDPAAIGIQIIFQMNFF